MKFTKKNTCYLRYHVIRVIEIIGFEYYNFHYYDNKTDSKSPYSFNKHDEQYIKKVKEFIKNWNPHINMESFRKPKLSIRFDPVEAVLTDKGVVYKYIESPDAKHYDFE